jgi:hypothetical protein
LVWCCAVVTLSLGWAACNGEAKTALGDGGTEAVIPADGGPLVGEAGRDGQATKFDIRDVIPAESCLPSSPVCWSGTCSASALPGVGCVAGAVVDERRQPLGGGVAFVCFGGNCLRPAVDENGFFSQTIDQGSLEVAFYWGGFPSQRLTPYCRYESLCSGAFLQCQPFVLYPAPTTGTPVPDTEMEALSEETTIEAEDGARLTVAAGDALLRPLIAEAWVALTRFPLQEHQPCFIDSANLPLALYAVTPGDSFVVEPESSYVDLRLRSAALDVPNESGLAPGTVLDVYVLGGPHGAELDLPEGDWRPVTTATVSDDGRRIVTAFGQGISYLTWFGIYPQ